MFALLHMQEDSRGPWFVGHRIHASRSIGRTRTEDVFVMLTSVRVQQDALNADPCARSLVLNLIHSV